MIDPEAVDASAKDKDELQFDHAEYDEGETDPSESPIYCAACKQEIPDAYYELKGTILCEPCRDNIQSHLTGGSRIKRFMRASLYGVGAAIAGFAIYYGVMKVTNLELALISILVGFMVGKAVNKGSDGRGGFVYQALAIFLTYTAIVASYTAIVVPQVLADLEKKVAEKEQQKAAALANPGKPDPAIAKPAAVEEDEAAMPKPSLKGAMIALVMLIGMAYYIPIASGFEQPIGLLIIGFALWEAWKFNRRVRLEITGPYQIGDHFDQAPSHA